MMKYKQVNVVHPEDVGVPRKLMSYTPREENFPKAFQKSKLPIIIIALLVLAIIIGFIPWSRTVDLNFYVTETDIFRNIIAEGQMQLQGKLIYQLFRPQRLEVENFQLMGMALSRESKFPITMEVVSSDGYLSLWWPDIVFHDDQDDKVLFRSMRMYLSTRLDCAHIDYHYWDIGYEVTQRRFYSSIDPDLDIKGIEYAVYGYPTQN